MSSLEIRVDPGAMGFEPARLERIRPHFDAYVEDRRLAGWLATVARGGELVWTAKGGYRDREKDLEVTDDTIWRIYSMTKPITSIAVMMPVSYTHLAIAAFTQPTSLFPFWKRSP